jgi:hypothetical protein
MTVKARPEKKCRELEHEKRRLEEGVLKPRAAVFVVVF